MEVRWDLIQRIRFELIGLLRTRYIFRTHQEIVRRNPALQGVPAITFARWGQGMYSSTNSAAVRRIAGATYDGHEVNLVRLIDLLIQDPSGYWRYFEAFYPDDAALARKNILARKGELVAEWEIEGCKRILSKDRKGLINATEKTTHFASKRVAHAAPDIEVDTRFSDVDKAIDLLKSLTERYVRIMFTEIIERLGPAHPLARTLSETSNADLSELMKSRLPKGWESIFSIPWATEETLALPLGDVKPPNSPRGT